MKSSLYVLTCIVLLCSCGGGSGGSDNGASSNANSTETSVAVADTGADSGEDREESNELYVSDTSSLVTTESFLFDSSKELSVLIDIPAMVNTRAYINICHLKADDSLDYQSCLVKSPIHRGKLQRELTLGNEVGRLGLSIWYYDPDIEPLIYYWQREDGMNWLVDS